MKNVFDTQVQQLQAAKSEELRFFAVFPRAYATSHDLLRRLRPIPA